MTKTAPSPKKAQVIDSAAKERNLARLRRIEGQVRGIHKMVEEDRSCADVLVQISAVHEALRGVGRELMRNHLRHYATAAMRGTQAQATEMHDEILELMFRHVR
jgi:DNA-binding FrmR family transcriptional regulator